MTSLPPAATACDIEPRGDICFCYTHLCVVEFSDETQCEAAFQGGGVA